MARLLRPCIYYLWLGSLVSAASVISDPSSRVTHGTTDACCSTSTSAISAETTDASTTIPSATSTRATGGTIAVNLPFTTDPSIRVEGKTPLTPTGPSDLNPKLQFVLPRTVIATWNDLGSQYHYCWMWMTLSEKLCKTTSEAQVRADRVPAGQEIQFWLNLSNNTMAWVVTLCYIPWQLRVGSSTSSFIMVEWASGEGVGEVCWDADGSRHTKALPQGADSRCEAVDFTDNYHVIKGLQPNTSYNVTLIQRHPLSFTVTTKDQDSYESLAWRCHENPCGTNRNCFPATSGLIQPRHVNDPVPDSYLYTCRSRKQAPLSCQGICHPSHEDVRVGSSTDLVVPEGHIVITHADFSTVSAQVANCVLPTALAVLKYWCDGKPVCHIEYGRLHSYLDGAHGCSRHTALQDFTLTLRFSTNLTNPGCSDGMQLYNNTCYGYGMLDETDFNTGRQSCLLLGGDIAYYINDKEFLDLWQGEWWTLGEQAEARPPQVFTFAVDQAYVSGGNYHQCGDDCGNRRKRALCALPPTDSSVQRLSTTTIHNDLCQSSLCHNGATCFPASVSLGVASQVSSNAMCRCGPGYSGPLCELDDGSYGEELAFLDDGFYTFSTGNLSQVWSVEFAYFGRNKSADGDFPGCYSPSALTLLRYKCDGRNTCQVSWEDLHNHLPSSCHPAISPRLSVRLAKSQVDDEWKCAGNGKFLASQRTCLQVLSTVWKNPHDAKLDCNLAGGDLAFYQHDLQLDFCPVNITSVWAALQHDGRSRASFDVAVKFPAVALCDGEISTDGARSALCEFPMIREHRMTTVSLVKDTEEPSTGRVTQSLELDNTEIYTDKKVRSNLPYTTASATDGESLIEVIKFSTTTSTIISATDGEPSTTTSTITSTTTGESSFATSATTSTTDSDSSTTTFTSANTTDSVSTTTTFAIIDTTDSEFSTATYTYTTITGSTDGEPATTTATQSNTSTTSTSTPSSTVTQSNTPTTSMSTPSSTVTQSNTSTTSTSTPNSTVTQSNTSTTSMSTPNSTVTQSNTSTTSTSTPSSTVTQSNTSTTSTSTPTSSATITPIHTTPSTIPSTVPSNSSQCPETVPFPDVYPEYTWSAANPGKHNKSCPDNTGAQATWTCGHDGQWIDLPDLSECKSLDFNIWEDQFNDNTTNTTAGEMLGDFVTNITQVTLAPGDIVGTVGLLDVAHQRHLRDLQDLNDPQQVLNVTESYVFAVTQVSSKLMEKAQVWSGLPPEFRYKNSSSMQLQVDTAAVEMSLLLNNETKKYNTDNLGVRTERFSEQHYQQTPENRVFQHSIPGNQIELPEGFQNSLRDVEMVAVSFTEFLSLHCVLSQGVVCESWQLEDGRGVTYPLTGVVNSHMMGMKVGNSTWSTASPTEGNITITFKHIFSGNRYNLSEDSISCVWWDVVNSRWSTHGCQLISYNTSSSQCSCDHLTNFAIIMDINGIIDINEPMLVWITYIGCSLSLVGLAAAILTLTSLLRTPGSRGNLTNLIHLNLCCCLLVSEVVMLSGLEQTGDAVWCGLVAGLLHYLLLATFCWMGVEGVNLYFMIVQVFETKYSPKWYYHAVSYGLPLVIVAISAASRPQGYGTDEFCWLNPHDHGMIWAFAGPALFILLMNLVIFAMVLRVLRQTPNRCESEKEKKSRRLLRHSVTLVTILGLTWLTGFLFFSEGTLALAVIFTVLNSLQGAMLFLVLVVMQDNRRTEFLRIVRFSNSLTYRFISKTAGTTTTAFAAHNEVPINPRYSGELDLCVSRDLQERIHNTDNKRY